MATDAEILAVVITAFAGVPRTERTHDHLCDECDEHSGLLASRDHATLTIDDAGRPSWDPITGVTAQAFAYWLPALARLTLTTPDETTPDWYGEQLFFHLAFDGRHNARWQYCTPAQRAAVRRLLEHVVDTRAGLIAGEIARAQLYQAIEAWAEADADASP